MDLINLAHFDHIFAGSQDLAELSRILAQVCESVRRSRTAQAERKKVRSAHLELESKTEDLEDQVRERTKHLDAAKKEIDQKVLRVRKLIQFLKELSVISSVEDLLLLVRNEIKLFHQVKDPILVFDNSSGEVVALYLQGPKVVSKLKLSRWPLIHRSRLNDKNDSQYLADNFARPFAKVLSIPLSIQRSTGRTEATTPGVLYLEHSLDEPSKVQFLQFVEERLPALSLAMDRVFLENDMREASHLWEKTFDGITDPVAIFDADGHLVRSNRAFQDRLSRLPTAQLFFSQVKHADRTYDVKTYPVAAGQDQVPTNVVVHYIDVTMAHQLQKRMIQQEKMVALGHLAGHVAHELNNPLTGIRSLSQVLVSQLAPDSRVKSDLVEVERAAERCQLIIKNLLDFSKGGVENRLVSVDINEIIIRTLPLLKTLFSNFEQNIELSKSPLPVLVEPHLLQQVVFNLIKNACQAMSGMPKGRISIWTEGKAGAKGEVAQLHIQYTGVGIPAELHKQIFDFFFTTKESGQGTGLGLSMSKSILESFGGGISLKSQVGSGSTFTVELPLDRGLH